MPQKYAVFFLTLFFILVAQADEKANFAGEWSFNRAKSEFGEGGDRFVPVRLVVTQNDTLMLVERTYQREYDNDFVDTLKFTLDGKENYSEFWRAPRTITATWSENGQLLTIITKITFRRDNETSDMTSTEMWRLIENGSVLSRDFAINGPMGTLKATYIFTRME